MPRNGAGTFSLVTNTWFPPVNGVLATSSDWTPFIGDVASAMTQSVSNDGQTTMVGNLPMGNNKITGLQNGVAVTDAAAIGQLQSSTGNSGSAGDRQRLINANFKINQRVVTSPTVLVAFAYGLDRWKAGAGGCTINFVGSGPDRIVTINAGTLMQVVEAESVEGGNYVLSWTGTAQGKIAGGAFGASPVTATGITANANLTVEFSTGTLSLVQLEPGSTPTPYMRRSVGEETMLCRRYYQTSYEGQAAGTVSAASGRLVQFSSSTSSYVLWPVFFSPRMRTTPAVVVYNPSTGATTSVRNESAGTDFTSAILGTASIGPAYAPVTTSAAPPASQTMSMHYSADAEL